MRFAVFCSLLGVLPLRQFSAWRPVFRAIYPKWEGARAGMRITCPFALRSVRSTGASLKQALQSFERHSDVRDRLAC